MRIMYYLNYELKAHKSTEKIHLSLREDFHFFFFDTFYKFLKIYENLRDVEEHPINIIHVQTNLIIYNHYASAQFS